MRCILILGPNRGGTSCIAQILHNLGIPMTATELFGLTYEDMGLFCLMKKWGKRAGESIVLVVNAWVKSRMDSAVLMWGAKHPRLCSHRRGSVILDIILQHTQDLKIIAVHRPPRDIAMSNQAIRSNSNIDKLMIDTKKIRKTLQDRKQLLRQWNIPVLHIGYYKVLDNSPIQVGRIIDFCFEGFPKPSKKQIKKATDDIDPGLRHIYKSEVVANSKPWRGFDATKISSKI